MTVTHAAVAFRPELLDSLIENTTVRFPVGMPDHTQALMASLGVNVRFDASMPTPAAWQKSGA